MKFVVYHRGCPDGMTAAWALWKQFGDHDTVYVSASYGDAVTFPHPLDAKDDVVFADYAWKRDAILGLAAVVRSVTVLDHHKSAAEDLAALDAAKTQGYPDPSRHYFIEAGNIRVEMDMNRSGAGIAWDWAHPGKPRPRIVDYAEDGDLWRFKLPYSHEIRQWMRSFAYSMPEWDHAAVILQDDLGFQNACNMGRALLKFERQQVRIMAEHANWRWILGHPVPVANASAFFSEVCEELLKNHPSAKYAAYYWDRRDNIRQWGLRSRGDFDVSRVAIAHGGGGHAVAAGWTEPATFSLPHLADGSHDS